MGAEGGCKAMNETFDRWDAAEELVHHPEDAAMYLEACVDEDPGDGSVILAALNDIARAQSMSGLARDAGLNRSNLYKALSESGSPSFSTVLKILRALNLRLRIEAA